MICEAVRVGCRQYLDSKKCPVKRAKKLHRNYMTALHRQDLFYREKEYGVTAAVTLQSAEFVMQLCRSLIDSERELKDQNRENKSDGKIKEQDIVKRLRSSPNAKSMADTQLHSYIEGFKQHRQELKDDVEKAAQELIDQLRSEEFHDDLLKNHSEFEGSFDLLTSAEVLEFYPDIPADQRCKTKIRTMDHICADLTDHLAASDNGMAFLADLLDEDKLKNLPAFDSVWNLFTKGKSAIEASIGNAQEIKIGTEAFGRFVQNVIPQIDYRIKLLLHEGAFSSADALFNNGTINKVLTFLDSRFNLQISSWVRERTAALVDTINTSMEQIKVEFRSWETLSIALADATYSDMSDLANDTSFREAALVHEHLKRLDSAHIALALDSISLFLSCVRIASDVKNLKASDILSGVNDLMAVIKTSLETYESALTLQSARMSSRKADLYLKSARTARLCAKALGITAAVLSTIISIIDLHEGIGRRDRQQIGVASAGIVLGAGAIVTAALSMAVLSGVLLVAGFIVAVVTMIILDPPILNYLEDIYWGKDYHLKSPQKRILIGDTINRFFSMMFTLDVRYVEDKGNKDYSRIEIRSGAITDEMPIFIEVVDSEEDFESKQRFFSSQHSIMGKGRVYKTTHIYLDDGIVIENLHEIWPILNELDSINIAVGIDPNASVDRKWTTFALYKELKNVKVDFKQGPILRSANQTALIGRTINQTQLYNNLGHIDFNAHRVVDINAYTVHAKGCEIKVEMYWDDSWMPRRQKHPVSRTVAVEESGVNGISTIRYPLFQPEKEYYDAWFKIILMLDNKEIDSTTYDKIRITRNV